MRIDVFALVFNSELFTKTGKRVVDLACGHKALTRNVNFVNCARCERMLDSGEDWDAFRHLGGHDEMAWPEDPCRSFNEPHDLAGNPLRD